jgi:hypothetical protein
MAAETLCINRLGGTKASVHTNQNVAECAGLIGLFFPSLQGATAIKPYKMLPILSKCAGHKRCFRFSG